MNDYNEIIRLIECTIHKYMQLEQKPHSYGQGINLTQTETHTISVIGDNPNINITSLAKLRGVTKGAASQIVYKLVDKGYVNKEISPNSDSEVCLTLTNNGVLAYDRHFACRNISGYDFFKELNDMPKGYKEYTIKMLKKYNDILDEHIAK